MARTYRYKAFISYSHSDRPDADRLLKSLESYRIPRHLKASANDKDIPSHVGKLFRDRDELPAAEDLTAEVKKALIDSEFMIVLCSPAAAASRWVNREIIEFKKLNGEGKLLSVILSGEPFAETRCSSDQECFPPALRFRLANNGQLTRIPAEPLAADFRPNGDGRQRGLLKLVAGLMGVGLDTLIARDLKRKMRRVTMVTAASLIAMLGMSLLTYEAVTARQEAEYQRSEAEGLIEFMLTDLRDKLIGSAPVGVLNDVNQHAIAYYRHQENLGDLSTESLGRRARVQQALGYDDEMQCKNDQAQEKYKEFNRTARALLDREPENHQWVLLYAESINRLALTGYEFAQTDNRAATLRQFLESRRLMDTIADTESDTVTYLWLSALVDSNICVNTLTLGQPPLEAIPYCVRAVEQSRYLSTQKSDRPQYGYDYAFHVFWYGVAAASAGDMAKAEALLREAFEINDSLLNDDPQNFLWLEQKAELSTYFAKFLRKQDRHTEAEGFQQTADDIGRKLALKDPVNCKRNKSKQN